MTKRDRSRESGVYEFQGMVPVVHESAESAHIGHGAVIHGARICRNALIGLAEPVSDLPDVARDVQTGIGE